MNEALITFVWIFAGIFTLMALIGLIGLLKDYSKAAKTVKLEIDRSEGRELAYWRRELKALRLALIPGISLERAQKITHKHHKYEK